MITIAKNMFSITCIIISLLNIYAAMQILKEAKSIIKNAAMFRKLNY